jgi:CBS-domain-containing membrane protein
MSGRGGWRQEAVAAVILLALAAVGLATQQPVLLAPFAASAALIAVTPKAPGAAPRTVLLAYLMATALGVIVLVPGWEHVGARWLAATIGTVLALCGMRLADAVHLPATALPVLLGATGSSAIASAVPVALGTVVLAVLSAAFRMYLQYSEDTSRARGWAWRTPIGRRRRRWRAR